MNVDDAAKVLNESRFCGVVGWRVGTDDDGDEVVRGATWAMTPFVAIAIAEKLVRDAGRDMPATRKAVQVLAEMLAMRSSARDGTLDYDAIVLRVNEIDLTEGDIQAAIAELEGKP